jgi:hypothetical protein
MVGNHLLLRDFGPYGAIFMNMCEILYLPLWYGDYFLSQGFGLYGIKL